METASHSIAKFFTTGWWPEMPSIAWYVVNCQWPLTKYPELEAQRSAAFLGAKVLTLPENMGARGNFSWALNQINFKDDDFILNYDLNGNPQQKGWLKAMIEVLASDKTLSMVGLLHNRIVDEKPWKMEKIAGYNIASSDSWSSSKTCIYPGRMMREGTWSRLAFYGFLEEWMFEHAKKFGLRPVYLYDYREALPFIPDPLIFKDWKYAHAFKNYPGRLEDYLKERS
jgi:hypothetical protein